jgi:Flp pilus assembly CpaE family ATPase
MDAKTKDSLILWGVTILVLAVIVGAFVWEGKQTVYSRFTEPERKRIVSELWHAGDSLRANHSLDSNKPITKENIQEIEKSVKSYVEDAKLFNARFQKVLRKWNLREEDADVLIFEAQDKGWILP